VLDRFIQQAVMQALQRSWDGTFSKHRYGFRPKRSAHQAVAKAQQYQAEGYRWVVDLDLEKFFDRVNHDRLLAKIAEKVSDKRLLKLIRAFLRAGVMENGLVSPAEEGTPQGSSLTRVIEHRTQRTGSGAGTAQTSLRAVCGRLQYLCPQPTSGTAGDDECHALPHASGSSSG
jgi:retron-type reverse transcriptase